MKYLGIDYGTRRLGLAVSGELDFSYPLAVIENTETLLSDIEKICKDNKIESIVIGESKDFAQNDNEIMTEVREFKAKLEESLGLPVHLHPEFLTSMEAERLQGSNSLNDASAAALILKSYLDTINNKNNNI
ncbi:Holliday junction resolvase RuvX [Patescibacteria group bacterium]|nr:Holliday junction resolvase RuvX [Patescibacteria group bacterium]